MKEELFGELHEQEEYRLFGKEHQRKQCFLHSVSVSVCYNRDYFYYDKTDNTCVGNYKACTVKQTER